MTENHNYYKYPNNFTICVQNYEINVRTLQGKLILPVLYIFIDIFVL